MTLRFARFRFVLPLLLGLVSGCERGEMSTAAREHVVPVPQAPVGRQTPAPGSLAQEVSSRLLERVRSVPAAQRDTEAEKAIGAVPRALRESVLMELLQAGGDENASALSHALMLRWSFEEPTDSAAFALRMPPGEARKLLLGFSAMRWSASDPRAALGWVESLAAGSERDELLRLVLSKWAGRAPAELQNLLLTRPELRPYAP
ncbi:hypothetical protein [Nibricoccus sp. IMCC34717]|uniref:hypothetical protein n=1 Tax=Nibricoccus sp. IMCC34717 TaxID=3034021 RepID=UPI00384BB0D1